MDKNRDNSTDKINEALARLMGDCVYEIVVCVGEFDDEALVGSQTIYQALCAERKEKDEIR